MLGRVALMLELVERAEKVAEREIEKVRAANQERIASAKAALGEAELELIQYVRKHKAGIFAGGDRNQLPHGVLYLRLQARVKRARAVLENLEKLGRTELIKIAKSVDWDKVDKLPDSDLAAIGTERVRKESIEYEIIRAAPEKGVAK